MTQALWLAKSMSFRQKKIRCVVTDVCTYIRSTGEQCDVCKINAVKSQLSDEILSILLLPFFSL